MTNSVYTQFHMFENKFVVLLFYTIRSEIERDCSISKLFLLQKFHFIVKWSIQADVHANNAIAADSESDNYGKRSSIHLGIFDETPFR